MSRKPYDETLRFDESKYIKIGALQAIEAKLKADFISRQAEVVDAICLQQKSLTNSCLGFRYEGETYSHSANAVPLRIYQVKVLHPSLEANFIEHQEDWKRYEQTHADNVQTVTKALMLVKSRQDAIDLLPECVHDCLAKMMERLPEQSHASRQGEIMHFREENKEALQMIAVQLAMNMLR